MVGIKDFDIPSCCSECQMASCKGLSGQFYCDITTYDVDMDDTERDADCPLIEAIPKDQHEARLRADMVAMLTDLKNKIIDKSWNIDMYDDDLDFECCYLNDIDEVIQQKIDKLKEQTDGNDEEN